jgi:excisionase family DNA binding protein
MAENKLLTVQEVADRLSVHPDTVRQWIRNGEIGAIDLGGRAGYRISEADLERFMRERFRGPSDR